LLIQHATEAQPPQAGAAFTTIGSGGASHTFGARGDRAGVPFRLINVWERGLAQHPPQVRGVRWFSSSLSLVSEERRVALDKGVTPTRGDLAAHAGGFAGHHGQRQSGGWHRP
jgi:hypothetical protein